MGLFDRQHESDSGDSVAGGPDHAPVLGPKRYEEPAMTTVTVSDLRAYFPDRIDDVRI